MPSAVKRRWEVSGQPPGQDAFLDTYPTKPEAWEAAHRKAQEHPSLWITLRFRPTQRTTTLVWSNGFYFYTPRRKTPGRAAPRYPRWKEHMLAYLDFHGFSRPVALATWAALLAAWKRALAQGERVETPVGWLERRPARHYPRRFRLGRLWPATPLRLRIALTQPRPLL